MILPDLGRRGSVVEENLLLWSSRKIWEDSGLQEQADSCDSRPADSDAGMRTPSERMTQLLLDTGLCTRADLAYCEPFVRRMCQDLPDFDSVWLDTLVQQRILTPWQTECLQSDDPMKAFVERFVIREALGQHTFLAIDQTTRRFCVVNRIAKTSAPASPLESQLRDLINVLQKTRGTAPASIVLPTELVQRATTPPVDGAHEIYLVSPFRSGWTLDELLIRGGRMPFSVVAEIGRDLLSAMMWLESNRLLHGDLVLRNVRLSSRGAVSLVGPFVRRIRQPQFEFSDKLTLRDCDGVAPELVGTGRTADARSELYSLGCLLWQLLTSRPIALSADPVTRVMKLKEHDLPDVRTWVPDCPEWMARIVQSMTRRLPELRPASATDVLKQWTANSGNGHSYCRRLAQSMPDRSNRFQTPTVRRRRSAGVAWRWPVAAASVLTILLMLMAQSGRLPQVLRIDRFAGASTADAAAADSTELALAAPQQTPQLLPDPDPDGVIRLGAGQTFIAAAKTFPGTLKIVCDQSPTATILVPAGLAWQLQARTIELRGLNLVQSVDSATASDPAAVRSSSLLTARCESLQVSDCIVQSPSAVDNFIGMEWKQAGSNGGVVMVRRSVFSGGGYGLGFDHPPRRCELENVLLASRGGGVLCEFQKSDLPDWNVICRQVTQRFGYSVIDAIVRQGGLPRVELEVTSDETVYDPRMAVVRLMIPPEWTQEAIRVRFTAVGNTTPAIVTPSAAAVVYVDSRLRQTVILPESQIADQELLPAELTFVSSEVTEEVSGTSEWQTSALADFEGPKISQKMPGIDPGALPVRMLPSR
jgi:hypothetical protein